MTMLPVVPVTGFLWMEQDACSWLQVQQRDCTIGIDLLGLSSIELH